MTDRIILPRACVAAPIAHRGLYDESAPENSLGAARRAIAGGYAIELDLQPSADGEAMVFHDSDLERLTGEAGAVWERSAADLGALRLGGRSDEPIPSFEQFLETVDGRAMLFVELKGDAPAAANDAVLARAAALLARYDGPAAFMSFDRRLVAEARRVAPERPAGLVAANGALDLAALGAGFVTHFYENLPTEETATLRAEGVPVLAWTIQSQAAADIALRVADQITFSGFTPAA
jgi:glycerophosphoryl diester phosphodiesterase